jgi:hypothetical protein
MLIIKNLQKIRHQPIVEGWLVFDVGLISNTLEYEFILYNTLGNGINGIQRVYLERECVSKNKRWYKLYTERRGKLYVQLVTIETIQNIKELLEHIQVVGID